MKPDRVLNDDRRKPMPLEGYRGHSVTVAIPDSTGQALNVSMPLRELRPAQGPSVPSLKPFEKTARPEPVSFWSEVFALFEASSSPTVASDDNERDRGSDTSERTAGIGGDHASNNADGETDAGGASDRNAGSNTSASNDRSANSGGGRG